MNPDALHTFCGNITIQTMERQSGIFIGDRNSSVGWSAHSKTNGIFSSISGSRNLFIRNVSILHDPDQIDAPIDDRDIHISTQAAGTNKTNHVSMQSLNIASMMQNSSVFLGDGHVTGMEAHEKDNNGQGDIYGNQNVSALNCNLNLDQDVMDGNIYDQDIKTAKISGGRAGG